jgi:hypothetical protein
MATARYGCGVRANGTVACWGGDLAGETSPPSGTFTQVSAGDVFTCGLKTDDHVACWGNGNSGQLSIPPGI